VEGSRLSAALLRNLFSGMLLAYVAASLALGGTPRARLAFMLLAGSWFCLLLLAPARLRGADWILRLRWLEVIGFNLALTVVLAETTLRIYGATLGVSWVVSDALDAYRLVPGQDYGGGLRGNRLGFPGPELRAEKAPGIFRIAALGDSFAVGPTVPFADNFLTRLERGDAALEVDNFGVSGTGPREYRLILNRHVWEYRPDLLLVCLFVGNDITETLATPRHLDPRQSSLYLLLTRAGRLLREKWRCVEPGDARDQHARGHALAPETFVSLEARRLAVCAKEPGAALEKKWRQAFGHLEGMISDCQRHRRPVAVVLIPDEFQVNRSVFDETLRAAGLREEDFDLTLPQRRLSAFFTSRRVPCLDLLPAFAGCSDAYTPRDTHWNVRGNRLAADHMRPWLDSLRIEATASSR
jgi:hypothetical protein